MINKANNQGITVKELGDKYIEEVRDMLDALSNKTSINPRATEYIKDIIKFVEELIEAGFAYQSRWRCILQYKKFIDYGKLAGQNLEDLQAGARISVE